MDSYGQRSDAGSSARRPDQTPSAENMEEDEEMIGQQVVLHEDKQYYPDAEQVFGEGVEALVEEEDHQPLTQPIVEPPKSKYHQLYRKEAPKLFYTTEYMVQLMSKP